MMSDEAMAIQIAAQVLVEFVPSLGPLTARAVALRVVSALVELEIIDAD